MLGGLILFGPTWFLKLSEGTWETVFPGRGRSSGVQCRKSKARAGSVLWQLVMRCREDERARGKPGQDRVESSAPGSWGNVTPAPDPVSAVLTSASVARLAGRHSSDDDDRAA